MRQKPSLSAVRFMESTCVRYAIHDERGHYWTGRGFSRDQRSLDVVAALVQVFVLSRRVSIRFDATGKETLPLEATPDMPCEPYAVIGGKRVHFDFTGGNILPD